jgi:hypothetical protein
MGNDDNRFSMRSNIYAPARPIPMTPIPMGQMAYTGTGNFSGPVFNPYATTVRRGFGGRKRRGGTKKRKSTRRRRTRRRA